ncbi:DUF6893 family small protein [Mycobacterium hippophais]|jgi:hypothetical protein
MQTVGVTATVVVGLVALAGLVLGVRSIPDVKRYLKIRRM